MIYDSADSDGVGMGYTVHWVTLVRTTYDLCERVELRCGRDVVATHGKQSCQVVDSSLKSRKSLFDRCTVALGRQQAV